MVNFAKRGLILASFGFLAVAQCTAQQHSENGWALPPYDTLRVLMVFIEIDYDTLAHLEDLPAGNDVWPIGELPQYADSIFDPYYRLDPVGKLTAYYEESSLGNFIVLGDYYPRLLRIPYSQIIRGQTGAMFRVAVDEIEKDKTFISANGLGLKAFDYWSNSQGRGTPIPRSGSDFEGVDHIMVLTRNYHKFPSSSGQASPSSMGTLGGKRSDTYSVFSGGHRYPFIILKHELNHLFLGGNNFHAGGGNSPRFKSYLLPVQGGWSMMGGSNSSLLTCAGWDRYRLGWKAPGDKHLISARDTLHQEKFSDLDPAHSDQEGVYILRDFVRTGDVVRIKIPYIPESEFQQWLWIENHTTQKLNGSFFDQFLLEKFACTSYAEPGLYMTRQVDADTREGKRIYSSVFADYLRPLPANGSFDMIWGEEKVSPGFCVNGQAYHPYELLDEFENPLSGSHEQEQPLVDLKMNRGEIDPDEAFATMLKRIPGGFSRLDFMGNNTHAFRLQGNHLLGIGTNPASASMTTFLNARRKVKNPDKRNNNTIYLNGIRVEILQAFADGTLKIMVRFDDNELAQNRRWCGNEIVLNNHNQNGSDLIVSGALTLDRSFTTARFESPDTIRGRMVFTDPTILRISKGAEMVVEGRLNVIEDSQLIVENGAILKLSSRSKTTLKDRAAIYLQNDAVVAIDGRLKIKKGAKIVVANEVTRNAIARRTWQKKRVELGARELHKESAP